MLTVCPSSREPVNCAETFEALPAPAHMTGNLVPQRPGTRLAAPRLRSRNIDYDLLDFCRSRGVHREIGGK